MALKEALFDTSVLIKHFHERDKRATTLDRTIHAGVLPRKSVLRRFEVMVGATPAQRAFWNDLLDRLFTLSFDQRLADEVVRIAQGIRKRGAGSIGMAGLFIAATSQRPFTRQVQGLLLQCR